MARLTPLGHELHFFIGACMPRSQPACDALFDYLKSMIAPVLSRLGLRADDKEEVRSRTWPRLHKAFHAGRPDDRSNRAVVAYARCVARRAALTYLDDRNRRAFIKLATESSENPFHDVLDPAQDPERQLMIKEGLDFVDQCEPIDRFIFFMKLKGCSTAQIRADLALPPYDTNMSANAVDLRYHKLIKRLNEHFDE